MAKRNMVKAINLALQQEMEKDPAVVVMGEDVGRNGGVFRVTDGLFEKYGKKRVIDTPLAESGILGTAIGMALAGMKPVTEMQFSGFSYHILPQLEGHASRFRSRTQGRHTVPLVVRMPYGGGVRALEHHSESREALYAQLPGVKVAIPSGPRNARALLVGAIRDPDPVIFMEPKRVYRAFREEVSEDEEVWPLGRAQVVTPGSDITLVAWGAMVRPARAAAEALRTTQSISAEVIDLLTVSPLDDETIVDSVRKTGRCVIVQEAPRTLGISSEIVSRLNQKVLLYLEAPVALVTGYDVVTPYFGRENDYIPSQSRVSRALRETLDF
jgi:pyruvate dehydrogenase E1 component beta subunit